MLTVQNGPHECNVHGLRFVLNFKIGFQYKKKIILHKYTLLQNSCDNTGESQEFTRSFKKKNYNADHSANLTFVFKEEKLNSRKSTFLLNDVILKLIYVCHV